MVEVEHDGQKLSIDMLLLAPEIADSLSIRRFWGKGDRWKRKRERSFLFSPSPLPHLKSPLP